MAWLDRFLGTLTAEGRFLQAVLEAQQGQRAALERMAAVLELQVMGQVQRVAPPFAVGQPVDPQDPAQGGTVSYVDPHEQAVIQAVEEELTAVLGRPPSEDELTRALAERGV
jgi:hypothetical protein